MHPIERLRWIARADDEPAAVIAAEAAWTLGELARVEPPALLTASRRLVERHPECGPLWWVGASLIPSDDPFETARRLAGELSSVEVADRTAAALRSSFTSSDPLAASPPMDLLHDALVRRGAYSVRVIGEYPTLRREVRMLGAVADEVIGYDETEIAEGLEGAAVLIVEPCLAGPAGLLVPVWAAACVRSAADAGVPVWALLGPGRVLPAGLADAASRMAGEAYALVDLEAAALAVDASGSGPAREALGRGTCPPCPELVPPGAATR